MSLTPAQAVAQLIADQTVCHNIIHGAAGDVVVTDSGNVPTFATAAQAFLATPSVAGVIRCTDSTAPSSGKGLELQFDPDGNQGFLQSFSRDTHSYMTLHLAGQTLNFDIGSSTVGLIDVNGRLLIGYTSSNGAYNLQVNSQIFATSSTVATSDGRYKENQAALTDCLAAVCALTPKSFTWKTDAGLVTEEVDGKTVVLREAHNFPTGVQIGFIAQDVQTALAGKPFLDSIVKSNTRVAPKNAAGQTVGTDEEFFGIAEGNLISLLVGAVKELKAANDALTTRVAALEAAH